MRVRDLVPADLEQAAQIEAACFHESWSRALLEESLKSPWNLLLAAEEGGRLVGYGAACVIGGEGEIQRLAILKDYRQNGRGRELLEGLVKAAKEKGARAMTLEVRESNLAARRLYISAGFREEARRKDYYRAPREDAVIMWARTL